MTIFVDGTAKELVAIDSGSGIEWTQDLLGNYGVLRMDEDDNYVMSEDDFAWWEPVIEMLNEIDERVQELGEEARMAYEAQDFNYSDLDREAEAKLDWLRSYSFNREEG